MMPKISVVSTVFNGQNHFDKAIPSILCQDYKDFEYIIVNDGSTDQTMELLEKVAKSDSRVKIFSPGRLGRANALNFAVRKATGRYIFQQDFDDTSTPNRLSVQLQPFEKAANVGVVGGNYIIDDQIRKERYLRIVPSTHEKLVKALSKYIPIAHTTAAFRKSAWEEAGGYPITDDFEDLRLWIEIAKLGWKLDTVDQTLGTHYIYKKSFWASNFKYEERQRELAEVQKYAVTSLNLPWVHRIYPMARLSYHRFPSSGKKVVRYLIGSKEKDVS